MSNSETLWTVTCRPYLASNSVHSTLRSSWVEIKKRYSSFIVITANQMGEQGPPKKRKTKVYMQRKHLQPNPDLLLVLH